MLLLLQSHCPSEPSEEVRLQLVRLLTLLLEQAGAAIAAYASEVWSILTAVLKDSYHSVSMQGCYLAQQMAGAFLAAQQAPCKQQGSPSTAML